jgi:putative transposase
MWRPLQGRDDGPLRAELKALAEQYPKYGCPTLHDMLRTEGHMVNHKRTRRLYREEGLQVRTKRRKKLYRPRVPMVVPEGPNERWSVDFVSDQLANGRRIRIFNVVDDFSRECVMQIVDFSISGQRLARELDQLAERRKLPARIVMDNVLHREVNKFPDNSSLRQPNWRLGQDLHDAPGFHLPQIG